MLRITPVGSYTRREKVSSGFRPLTSRQFLKVGLGRDNRVLAGRGKRTGARALSKEGRVDSHLEQWPSGEARQWHTWDERGEKDDGGGEGERMGKRKGSSTDQP